MNAEDIRIEWDEDGCYIVIDGDSMDPDYQAGEYRWKVADPEQLYDRVKTAIGPWLRERDEAQAEYLRSRDHIEMARFECDPDESGGYDVSDPKHPRYHSIHADIHDMRERNPDEYEYLRTEAKREVAGE